MNRAWCYIIPIVSMCGGCGGGSTTAPDATFVGGGRVQLIVANAKAAATAVARLQAAQFHVVVSGPTMTPITVDFEGTATEGMIGGIPPGDDRRVEVTAVNHDGEVVRAGETAGVSIHGDDVAEAAVTLEQVPLFANLQDASVVPNTRLRLELWGAPGHSVSVDAGVILEEALDMTPPTFTPLVDTTLNLNAVPVDLSTGLASIRPRPVAPGHYQFRARDEKTGRQSSITVYVIDGTQRRAAPLVTAGMATARLGSPTYTGVRGTWPAVVLQLVE